MQVPARTAEAPAAHVISPCGGELLVAGATHRIEWAATDDVAVTGVMLSYSTDGGATYRTIATTSNTSRYDWIVPAAVTRQALVMVTAMDGTHSTQAVSAAPFTMAPARQTFYHFATGGGVDKFGWGNTSSSWSQVDGTRNPTAVNTELPLLAAGAYQAIAASDATGNSTDPNRYRAAAPGGSEESTHIFEFALAEDPLRILDIGIVWEGFAQNCTQMELYVWDYAQGQWGDGNGLVGENRYGDSFAGNRDGVLACNVRNSFEHFIGPNGNMTILVHAGRSGYASYHDFVGLTVTTAARTDLDKDGDVDGDDLDLFLPCAAGPKLPIPAGCGGKDLDHDNDVDQDDFGIFQRCYSRADTPADPNCAG
jgi:hypothetical protein